MIFILFSVLWQFLFVGGDFSTIVKNGNVYVNVYDTPHFNYGKYPFLSPEGYTIHYNYRIFQRTGNDVIVKDTSMTATSFSFPIVRDNVVVICEVEPRGKSVDNGNGQPYIMGTKRIKIIYPDTKLGSYSE